MTSITGPLPFDLDAAKTFLALLGKSPNETRLRGFLPTGNPLKSKDSGRKGPFSPVDVIAWQQEGRGIYAVINNGGDTDAAIASCNSLFVEWDDRPVEWQIAAWKELSLPEPSLIVLTGGKSVHVYWRFTTPIDPEHWRDLQTRLLEYADADRTLKNPSRVMRLPGAWHLGPDGAPNGQTTILGQPSGRSYTPEDFESILPTKQLVQEQDEARSFRFPSDFPSASLGEVQDALAHIPAAVPNEGQYPFYRNLTWALIKACEEAGGGREDAIAFMANHSPRFAEVRQVARSTFSHVNAGTFWWHAMKHGYRSPKLSGGYAAPDSYSAKQRQQDAKEAAEASEYTYTELIEELAKAYERGDEDAEAELTCQLKGRFKRNDAQIITRVFRQLTPGLALKKTPTDTAPIDDVHALEYLANGYAIKGKTQLLYASYGGGKTTMVVEKAIAICEGRSLLERRSITQSPGKALIIATDSGLQALKTTLQQLQYDDHPALDADNPSLYLWGQLDGVMEAWVADVPGILRLKRFVKEKQISYVAVDSVKTICAGGGFAYTDNDSVNNFLMLIERTICEPHDCCIEFISHTGTEKGSHSGAKAWAETPSMVCRLSPAYDETSQDGGQTADRKQIGVKAEWLKDRAATSLRSVTYALREAQGTLEALPDVEVVGSCQEAIEAALRLSQALGRDGMRLSELQSEICARHGRSAKTVANTLSAMCAGRSPLVVRPRGMRGIYALAPKQPETSQVLSISDESLSSLSSSLSLGGDKKQEIGIKSFKSTGMTEENTSPRTPDFISSGVQPLKSLDMTQSLSSRLPPDSSRSVPPDSQDPSQNPSQTPPTSRSEVPVCAPAHALYAYDSTLAPTLLDPLPIAFNDEAHRYCWEPTGVWLAYSVTRITGGTKSPEAMKRINETKHIWEPRGKHVHAQQENFLLGRDIDLGDYAEWIEPLLAFPLWKKLRPLGVEHRLADPERSIGGSLDALCEHEDGRIFLIDLKTQSSKNSTPYSTDLQMGAYASMLSMHYPLAVDRCLTIWAKPGGVSVTPADPAVCIPAWEACRDAFLAEHCEF